ncbi:tripartite tricarboxylate transporter TctB family protein [Paracoccus sp. S-4012]|uniref:tripartite tricarboxylate transporter TctB family protein n=1 Tax=Paracoccus sp. S-4012 TaxID=2665648 RepID=UPI0012B05A15|nr:tripartite tricarboxylate transporter TctB family protein [Paracoccus sp. S-4012]MRX50855.1 tripartite tricarboxylate transporter TctB family protein [Paracoccus sp. S-4012]
MRRDWHDFWGGTAMAAIGLGVAGWAAAQYDLGTLRRMGPGFFPLGLGLVLALIGAGIAVPALARTGTPQPIAWRESGAILGAIVVFGLGLERFGLIPTTAAAVLIATLPAPRSGLVWRIGVTLAVTAIAWAIFSAGLRMTVPLWPVGR